MTSEEGTRYVKGEIVRPRDSFDLGQAGDRLSPASTDVIYQLVSNPKKLIGSLGLTPQQAENITSIISGAGAGAAHKYLARHIGDELAAAAGGFLAAYLAKRVLQK